MTPSDSEIYPYLAAWAQEAREVLIDAARHYQAVIPFGELAEYVERRSGIDGSGYWHWMRKTLELVAEECIGRGEPILVALCVDGSRVVGEYSRLAGKFADIDAEEIESLAERERLKCYKHFGASGLPSRSPSARIEDCVSLRLWEVHNTKRESAAAKREEEAKAAELDRISEIQRRERARDLRYQYVLLGSEIEVFFDGNPAEMDTFIIADSSFVDDRDKSKVLPPGILRSALSGLRLGETVEYIGPTGAQISVTIYATKPYEGYAF